ncbi:hypothetical protein H4R18_005245 [Coemansia javaensis]|uniref:Uncharacterized protein n=1 Tax=Coemansia javaensis TaxID=2761396 RepID=A0A9W8H5L3_9FUNG|nr:hypothetical protein H4R18_005245 [Coemansia javaensis]
MYDMPMAKQVRSLRLVFVVNFFCSSAISLWVRGDDIYTVLAACGMVAAGFIPMAFAHLFYRNHVKAIRILGGLSRRALARARRAERDGTSQVEFPVASTTPLLVTKFGLAGRDPQIPLYVRDLLPGPDRRYSVQWLYPTPAGIQRFRVSKKVIQYHPDVRALDALIRANAQRSSKRTAAAAS